MPAPAKINSIAPISRISDVQTHWNTTVKQYPNGRVTTQANWSTPQHTWEIEFDSLTLAQYNALRDHFNLAKGQHIVFQFDDTHPASPVTYNVRYADDALGRRPISPNVRGYYNVRVKLEENK